ncbi:hypothetical protein ACMFMF_003609 [Clarireedia jacksonii]
MTVYITAKTRHMEDQEAVLVGNHFDTYLAQLTPSASSSQKQQRKLALLQPLATSETPEACQDPTSRIVCHPNGSPCSTPNREYLNISQLSKAWRQALLAIKPITEVVFDLIPPKQYENHKVSSPFQRVYWDTVMHSNGVSLGIHAGDVMTMVITIATEMRLRIDGYLCFDIIYDELEGVSMKGMTLLRKQLLALAQAKTSVAEQ